MQAKANTRSRLLDACEILSPFEQALLQLCSVIYEPVGITVLYKIFRKTGLNFPGEKIGSAKDLDPHVQRLKTLGLLNDHHQVAPDIVEIVTRRALAAGRIYDASKFLDGIESEQAWTDDPSHNARCISCEKTIQGKTLMSAQGHLCPSCAESEIRFLPIYEEIEQWPLERLMEALSPGGDLIQRLAVLWRSEEILRELTWRSKKDVAPFTDLLIQNLTYDRPHPLTPAVRRAAIRACLHKKEAILPTLIETMREEPWELYAEYLKALYFIAPDKPEVRAILEKASGDSNPEIRKCIVTSLSRTPFPWTVQIFRKLGDDPDSIIRHMAKTALAAGTTSRQRLNFYYSAERYESSSKPDGTSLRFGPLARAIHLEIPLNRYHEHSTGREFCPSLMREMRIGVYAKDIPLFEKSHEELKEYCSRSPEYAATARIFNNPFDEAWFAGLPVEMRLYALSTIFQQGMVHMESDAQALAFAMKDTLLESAPPFERATYLYTLASRLIMSGRIGEARNIADGIEENDYTGGIQGWLRFIEGNIEESLAAFETDLKELRRRTGKRNVNFGGLRGLFHVLALLGSQNAAHLKKAESAMSRYPSSSGDPDPIAAAFRSLWGILFAQKLDVEGAKNIIARESETTAPLPTLFNAIAEYWVNGSISHDMADRIDRVFHVAGDAGLDWIAMESAALLIRTDGETSVRRDFLDRVMTQNGMRPFVSSLTVEEPWQKKLRAVIQIAGASGDAAQQKSAAKTRLIWLVDYRSNRLSLLAMEQKLSARGGWSKGRPVAMSRLFNRTGLEYATQQDLALCGAIKSEPSWSHGNIYSFDNTKLLPALVGHPLLFLEKNPSVPLEFVKGEPEIMVVKSGSKLKIKFAVDITENRVIAVQETPTRFKVIETTDRHRELARVLGDKGLIVPASAKQDVLNAISALSSHVLVHSDIGGKSADAVEVPSDPTPHVHLLPSGPGFRVEIFVKPFREEGGPWLKPAKGTKNLLAEVGGKRMQTQRDLKAEEMMADAVETASPTLLRLADSDRQWSLEDPQDCLQVLLDLKTLQENGQVVVEWPEGEKLKVTREIPIHSLQMKIRGKADWFEVSGQLQVDDHLVLDMKRLLELVKTTNTRFIPLEDGSFMALTGEFRKRLEELETYSDKKGKEIRLHPLAALAVQDLFEAIPNLETDHAWISRLERIRSGQAIDPPLPSTLKAELRDYQLEGYTWLARLAHMGIGACLADDMGLGKTIQALALLLHRAAEGPSLVVAPTSVCWNWISEAARFAPTLNVVQFDGTNREELIKTLGRQDVLVTSYGLLIQETELLSSVEWNVVVLDEAQAIKNFMTKRSQAAMGLKGGFRIITTGTPIENHLGEFWSLFNFINPGLLGSLQRFNKRFADPIEKYKNKDARKRLKKLIQPFILRRLKSQVLEELPPRTEVVLQVEMSREEKAFYEALRQQALEKIEGDNAPVAQKHLKILAEIMKLRQAACNPRLILPETSLSSAKLELFGEVVSELLENRHKALVFSQFVGHLNLIREFLDARNIAYRYLDGSTPPKERQKEVEAFQSGEGDLFLISLKAGGMGLNLTVADYVIHMDPWWNPAVEDQASDRAHRIGQQHPVTVYRLVSKGTIEEKIVKLHQEKRDLAGSLLDGSDIGARISADELIRLIKDA